MKNSRKIILIVLLALLLIAAITVAACTPDDPTHQHTFAQEWSSNRSEHWHAATCGHKVTSDRAAHNFGTDDVCDTCGYTKGQGGDNPGGDTTHQHTFAEQWSISDAEHWHAATCNHDVTADNAAHTLVNNVCSVCGYQNNVNWDDFTFEQSDDGYVLTKYNGTAAHVNIPDTYNDLPVVGIGEEAFCECRESLISVTIPDSVIFLTAGDGPIMDPNTDLFLGINSPFGGCEKLTTVNFGSNSKLESIGDYSFYGCENLANVNIGSNSKLESIGERSFYGCSSLTDITIPDGVTSIGDCAFYDCISLTSVNIPDSVTSMGKFPFDGCFSLIIYCEVSEQPSEWYMYWNSSSWFNLFYCPVVWNCNQNDVANDGYEYEIVDGIRYGFKDNEAKVHSNNYSGDITIPSNVNYKGKDYAVTSIDNWAFGFCSSFTSVTIPTSATSIGYAAFVCCDNLLSVTLGCKIESIGYSAFDECANLQNVYYDGTIVDWCGIAFSDTYSNPMYCAENFYIKKNGAWQEVTEIEIPDGVTEIGDWFSGFDNLTSITIPDSVTSIGYGAFRNCSSLLSIVIPDNVTSIDNSVFYNCTNLATVNIGPNSKLESIGDWAFENCHSLTSITIPAGVTTIGRAFESCSSLVIYCEVPEQPSGWDSSWNIIYSGYRVSVVCPVIWNCLQNNVDSNGYIYGAVDGALYGFKDNEAKVYFQKYTDDVIIPSTVNYQGKDYTVTSIGDGAYPEYYNGNPSITITIPNSIKSIGKDAFFNSLIVKYLKNVYYDGTIADWCAINFNNPYSNPMTCTENFYIKKNGTWQKVTEIEIPNGVTEIGNYQFCHFDNVTSITIPESVTKIDVYAFAHCISLTSITIPDNVTRIFNGAFYNCTNLARVNIGLNSKLESIDKDVFNRCSSLTSVTIPDSVTSIGDNAFSECSSLTSIFIPKNVTNIGSKAFDRCYQLTIYFGMSKYDTPSGWDWSWEYQVHDVVWGATRQDAEQH